MGVVGPPLLQLRRPSIPALSRLFQGRLPAPASGQGYRLVWAGIGDFCVDNVLVVGWWWWGLMRTARPTLHEGTWGAVVPQPKFNALVSLGVGWC